MVFSIDVKTFSDCLKIAFNNAWTKLISEHDINTFRHVNESVFRYFIVRELISLDSKFDIEDEWHRIDLLLKSPSSQAAVELKFYDSRPLYTIDGLTKLKGGAGSKNFSEFLNSLRIINSEIDNFNWYREEGANINERFFILIGTKRISAGRNGDFKRLYFPVETIDISLDIKLEKISEHFHSYNDLEVFGWLCRIY